MWNEKPSPAAAGRPPPRPALAVAAAAVAVALHAAVFGLFDQHARQQERLAAAVGPAALAECRRDPDRARQRACVTAAVARARSGEALAWASGR